MSENHSKNRGRLVVIGLLMAFCGCKVGPDYCKPSVDYLHRDWTDSVHGRFNGQPVDEKLWWKSFNDETLENLVGVALANNLDLKQAGQRILEARALRQVAAGNLFPQQQSANAGFNRIRISENDANFVVVPGFFQTATTFNSFTSNFSAAWELDFWGKYRRLIESADANVEATVAAYGLAKVLLVGEVARTYIDLRTIERRILLAQQNIEIQSATLKLTEQKLEAGTAVKLDYHQSRANLAQTESVVPTLEILRRQANHQLCVLLGQVPEDVFSASDKFGNVPQPPPSVAIGIPNDLLRRRPDIQIAERELAAQCARIGVAKADFYPQLSLVGTVGVAAQDLNDLFRPSSLIGATGPAASWNVLNYGRIKNRVVAEKEAFERLRLAYHDTILNAYREAQDSQAAFVNYWDRMQDLQVAAENSAAAVNISQIAFAEGATDFNRVYLLQSDLVQTNDSLAENQGKLAQSLVNLYVALGGGWSVNGSACNEFVSMPMIESFDPLLHDEKTHHAELILDPQRLPVVADGTESILIESSPMPSILPTPTSPQSPTLLPTPNPNPTPTVSPSSVPAPASTSTPSPLRLLTPATDSTRFPTPLPAPPGPAAPTATPPVMPMPPTTSTPSPLRLTEPSSTPTPSLLPAPTPKRSPSLLPAPAAADQSSRYRGPAHLLGSTGPQPVPSNPKHLPLVE